MKQPESQKMCPNCDGRIPQESTQCPYCFAQLQADLAQKMSISPAAMDPLSALYPPPYSSSPSIKTSVKPSSTTDSPRGETVHESIPFWSISMLALGSNLLTLGMLQFFFSEHGVLQLEMNASYWFLMVIVAAPLIYFGLKNLKK